MGNGGIEDEFAAADAASWNLILQMNNFDICDQISLICWAELDSDW